MSDSLWAVHPRGRLLAIIALVVACFVIAPPQTARADSVTFSVTTPSSNGTYPYNVAVADFNNDGKPDLAVADQTSAAVAVLLGNGDGTFTAGTSVAFPLVNYVYAADLNGDGKPDLINLTSQFVSSSYLTKINVRLGNGDGTFSATTLTTTAPTFTTTLARADFNGDGIADAAINDIATNRVLLFNGVGDGTFTPSTILPSGGANPFALAVADWFGDGRMGIAVANSGSAAGNAAVFRNTGNDGSGNPQFSPAAGSPYIVGAGMLPVAIDAGFLTGGTNPDLAVTAQPATNPTTNPSTLTPLINNGTGGFSAGTPVNVTWPPGQVKLAGITGSGHTDAVVLNYATTPGGLGSAAVYAGNGIGGFAATAVATIPLGHQVQDLAVGDFNRDGKTDIVATNADDNTITVVKNTTNPYPHPTPWLNRVSVRRPHAGDPMTAYGSGFVIGAHVIISTPAGVFNATDAMVSADGFEVTFTLPTNYTGEARVEVRNPDGEWAASEDISHDLIMILHSPNPVPPRQPDGPPQGGITNALPGNQPSAPPVSGAQPLPGRQSRTGGSVPPGSTTPAPLPPRR